MHTLLTWLALKPSAAGSEPARPPPSILASAVQLLTDNPADLVESTTVSQPVSSPQEGEYMKASAHRLAADNGLTAQATAGDGRVRVTFTRRSGGQLHDRAQK